MSYVFIDEVDEVSATVVARLREHMAAGRRVCVTAPVASGKSFFCVAPAFIDGKMIEASICREVKP